MRAGLRRPSQDRVALQVLTVTSTDPMLYGRCTALEYQVFVDEGYVEQGPEGRITELDPYRQHAFLAALAGDVRLPSEERELIGVMRIVSAPQAQQMGPGLFPTLDHAEELRIDRSKLGRIMGMDPRRFIDIATMAIPKENRDAITSRALIEQIVKQVWERPPLRFVLAVIDTIFYEKFKARKLPFANLGPSVLYWGSPSTAVLGDAFRMLKGEWIPAIVFHVPRRLWMSRR